MLHQIGVGALGPVFRTYEPTRDRLVAVKVFRLDITPEQAQALADQLAHAAEADLFHPSIVEPIAAGVQGTVAYRAEEYVAAESLDVAMRHYAPASPELVLRIIGQLAEAIDVARGAGVGHGALHPRDIFVTPDEARASGFGVVDALERVGIRAPVRRPYSAPERVAGADWSTPADVFSLAAIAFELLTGRRPSGTGGDIGPLTDTASSTAQAIESVLAKAMDDDPSGRYASGQALVDALTAAVSGASPHHEVEPQEPEPASESPSVPAVIQIGLVPGAAAFADEGDDDELEAPEVTAATEDEAPRPGPTLAFGSHLAAAEDPGAPSQAEAPLPSRTPLTLAGRETARDREIPTSAQEPEAREHEEIEAAPVEDVERWELTHQDAEPLGATAERDAGRYEDVEVEAAADALLFDAADLALTGDAGPAPHADTPRARGLEHIEDSGRVASAASPLPETGRRGAGAFEPPMSIPREVPRAARADERVPFQSYSAAPERERTSMLPLAMGLVMGLLLGFGGGYFVGQRGPRLATVADGTGVAAPPTEPTGRAAGTLGTAPADTDRPVPPGTATAPAPSAPPPIREHPAAPAATSGRLVVRSAPAGASVTINGKWSGRTPITRDKLPFGDYNIRLVLPGYEIHQEKVLLSSADASHVLSYQLQREPAKTTAQAARPESPPPPPAAPAAPLPATGALDIDSRPSGARVFLDDRPVGVTPLKLPEVSPGSHVIRMEMPEHRAWTETTQVARGKATRVAGSLEPIR